jgi:class 3 adenylate cyclase
MLEELWPYISEPFTNGLLLGSASMTMLWAAQKRIRVLYLRTHSRRDNRTLDHVERRLAAILASDVVGYSRLMNADEEGTHARLLAWRRDVMEPKVREHRGRIIKTNGDGTLVEFGSAVSAVRCALDVQKIMSAHNVGVPDNRRIDLRIAVNLGDVIVEPEDIYGHAVNLVARLESLAPPGGICVSADLWRHVRGAIPVKFIDLGEHQVKNIADPIHVFALSPDMSSQAIAWAEQEVEGFRRT